MLTKDEKVKFVENARKELGQYKVIGVVPLSGIPDRLLQSTKNKLKPHTRFIMGRKSLLKRVLESEEHTKQLANELGNTSAILLSNEDPFELYKKFRASSIRLAAKPGQVAPDDVIVQSGETSIQPGQAVTDLKAGGIDVQIQKGKVVIAKEKVLVKKGDTITASVAKALHTLEIMPFSAVIEPSLLLSDKLLLTKNVLGINTEFMLGEITRGFQSALTLSMERGIINVYTVRLLVVKAYNNALYLGVKAKIYDKGVIEKLISNAAMQAALLNSLKHS